MPTSTIQRKASELSALQQAQVEAKKARCRKAFEQSNNRILPHLAVSGIEYTMTGGLHNTAIRFTSRRYRAAVSFSLSEYGIVSTEKGARIAPDQLILTIAAWEEQAQRRRKRTLLLRYSILLLVIAFLLINPILTIYSPHVLLAQIAVNAVLALGVGVAVMLLYTTPHAVR